MKLVTTTVAVAALTLALGLSSANTKPTEMNHEADQLLACLWFPICRDPDFKIEINADDVLQSADDFGLDLKETYACLWFPICRDPDMPLQHTLEQSEAAIA